MIDQISRPHTVNLNQIGQDLEALPFADDSWQISPGLTTP